VPTFLITVVGWVLFRADTLGGALRYVGRLVGYGAGTTAPLPYLDNEL